MICKLRNLNNLLRKNICLRNYEIRFEKGGRWGGILNLSTGNLNFLNMNMKISIDVCFVLMYFELNFIIGSLIMSVFSVSLQSIYWIVPRVFSHPVFSIYHVILVKEINSRFSPRRRRFRTAFLLSGRTPLASLYIRRTFRSSISISIAYFFFRDAP